MDDTGDLTHIVFKKSPSVGNISLEMDPHLEGFLKRWSASLSAIPFCQGDVLPAFCSCLLGHCLLLAFSVEPLSHKIADSYQLTAISLMSCGFVKIICAH